MFVFKAPCEALCMLAAYAHDFTCVQPHVLWTWLQAVSLHCCLLSIDSVPSSAARSLPVCNAAFGPHSRI